MLIAEKDFSLMIFGASGALAKVKIFPAIYEMALEGRMPENYKIFGFARTDMSHEDFRVEFAEAVRAKMDMVDEKILAEVVGNCYYFAGSYVEMDDYGRFLEFVSGIEENKSDRVRIAYFSVPPSVFKPIINGLGTYFKKDEVPVRLVLEKPFGSDYVSAKALKVILTSHFDKTEIYLLDHYLGKEGVFNLLSLRYANPIFSYLLQGKYIANIQISAFEKEGLDGRAGYFDAVGTLDDMVQSHLFQILTFLTMNIPREFDADLVHKAKVQLLQSIYFVPEAKNVVRAQYEGYRQEKGVDPKSEIETYVALKVALDTPAWHGVPIFMRTGKSLDRKWTGVVIEFKPHQNQSKLGLDNVNRLLIEIQPNEKIEFYMLTKKGGSEMEFVPLTTGKPIYCSGDCLNEHARLLLDVIKGDRLLFLDFDEIYEAWKVTDKIAEVFEKNEVALSFYKKGSEGPEEADELMARDGFEWFNDF